MACVVIIINPFDPHKDAKRYEVEGNPTVREWLLKRFPGFTEFPVPTISFHNGKPMLRKHWDERRIGKDDIVTFAAVPGTGVEVLYWISAVLIVASIVIAVVMRANMPANTGQQDEADAVYTLKGQKNQVKLGQPIEQVFGSPRCWPSYGAQPYNQYIDNDQWLYQLFCLGTGEFVISDKRIEDTPIESFSDVQCEIYRPGERVTLFPTNVTTSVEVSGIELLGPNEAGGGGTWIVDSEGDPENDIPETGHWSYAMAGPYVANAEHTRTTKIECDVTLPRGLMKSNNEGGLDNVTVSATFEAQRLDDMGQTIGDWFQLFIFSKTLKTNNPMRYTLSTEVPEGRYQVRAYRTTNKDTDSRTGNTIQWEGLRAFLLDEQNFGDVTMVAVKARATNNLNSNSASRFNMRVVRMLPIWDKVTRTWSEPQPTRSFIWAFCAILKAEHGGQLTDTYLNLDALWGIDQKLAAREEYFDWIFDQKTNVWDACRLLMLACRAVPMLEGSRVSAVRDEPKSLPTAIYNPDNIVKGSFSYELKLKDSNGYDGLIVAYTDETTWKQETVLCRVGDDPAEPKNPERVEVQGLIVRKAVYHWGMYRRACAKYLRQNINLNTGMEGHIPLYGDLVSVSHDVPQWGQAGQLTAEAGTGTSRTVQVSEPVVFEDGKTYSMMVRRRNGTTIGPYPAVAGSHDKEVVLSGIDGEWGGLVYDLSELLPLFQLGENLKWGRLARIVMLAPGDRETVKVSAVKYDGRVFDGDTLEPPPYTGGSGHVPSSSPAPSVLGLIVTTAYDYPGQVIARWRAAVGALKYVVQLSYDALNYETVGEPLETSLRFSVLPKKIYVRVAAVGTGGAGLWAYWVGNAPVEDTNITIDPGVVPETVSDVILTAGFGQIFAEWKDPTNVSKKNIRAINVHVGDTPDEEDRPATPTAQIRAGQQFWSLGGLADNVAKSFWFRVEMIAGQFSAWSGPHTATTVNGITLDHLIPGGLQPVEIKTVLPSTGNYKGRLVFLTANDAVGADYITGQPFVVNKVYKWEGTGTYSSPVSGKDKWTAAVPTVDLSGQIISGQIADNAVLQAKIADNAISQAKLQVNIIDSTRLVDDAVTAAKVAAGAITETKIADDAITTAKIVAGAITASEIAAGAVIAGKIAANAVTATEIAANAITAAKIGAGEVVAGKIAANAVTANEIAANSIIAAKIAAGAVEASALAANSVTTAALAADSVVAGKIQAGAVTATAVGANEIITYTANIADAIITAAKIGDAQISNAKIQDAAITYAKIGDAEVDTLKIAGNAVTVPIAAQDAGPITVGANVTYDLLSCNSLTVVGSEPVWMSATFEIRAYDNNTHFFRFLKDGVMMVNWQQKIPVIDRNIFTITWLDYPGAGTYNWGLQVYAASGNSGPGDEFSKITMLALSARR